MRAPFEAIWANSVSTGPGQRVETKIPESAISAARAMLKLKTYAFVAPYTAKFPKGIKDARLATFTKREPFSMRGTQRWQSPVREETFKSIISS